MGSNSKTFIEKNPSGTLFNISIGSFNEYKNYTCLIDVILEVKENDTITVIINNMLLRPEGKGLGRKMTEEIFLVLLTIPQVTEIVIHPANNAIKDNLIRLGFKYKNQYVYYLK